MIEETINNYKKYRNELTKIIRTSRKNYYSNKFINAKGNMSSTWNTINKILNKQAKNKYVHSFKCDNNIINLPKDVANCFNEYFTNIGPNQAQKIDRIDKNHDEYLHVPCNHSVYFNPTNTVEILNIVKSLKSSYSTGHDEISTHLLKQIIHSILTPLVHIFNLSLTGGIVPTLLKTAKVIPIFKKEDPACITNYRPISLLSSFSKILERIVYNRIYDFFTNNNLFNPDQYGFRKLHSTDLALAQFYDRVSTALANHEHVIGVFMDLSKAFDTLDHAILLSKLQHYGIRGVPLEWFSSYLSNRKQFTCYENTNSDTLSITCGVPQGSILGPLLFLIYINDISNVSNILQCILFADDTNVFLSSPNFNTLVNTLNAELPKLSTWFKSNMLSLNLQKTNFIYFKHPRKQPIGHHFEIKIDNTILEMKTHTKFLGVFINENLNWSNHINYTLTPISRNVGVLHKLKYYLSNKILFMLYNSLILPYILYCNIIWANSKTNTQPLLLLQKKAIRICSDAGYRDHSDPLFARFKSLKINDIHFLQIALFMFRYNTDLLPMSFNNMFRTNQNVHSYSTRRATDIHLHNPLTALAHKSIRHSGPDVWNSLPVEIRNRHSFYSFKHSIKQMLITQYLN